MKNKTTLAYQIIKRVDFSKDYDVIEQQLKPILTNKISDDDLVDAIKGMFEDLQDLFRLSYYVSSQNG